jgi:hypothetical protein
MKKKVKILLSYKEQDLIAAFQQEEENMTNSKECAVDFNVIFLKLT